MWQLTGQIPHPQVYLNISRYAEVCVSHQTTANKLLYLLNSKELINHAHLVSRRHRFYKTSRDTILALGFFDICRVLPWYRGDLFLFPHRSPASRVRQNGCSKSTTYFLTFLLGDRRMQMRGAHIWNCLGIELKQSPRGVKMTVF